MPRKKEPKPAVTSPAPIPPQDVTVNLSFTEHKTGASYAVWLAAVGTALSGLAQTWTAFTTPPTAMAMPAKPNKVQTDQDHPTRPLQSGYEYAAAAGADQPGFPKIPPSSAMEKYVDGLRESQEWRQQFAYAVRIASSPSQDFAQHASDGEKAISVLLDPQENVEARIAAALYLGGHGKREYRSPLNVVAKQDDVIGIAARLAIEILDEHSHEIPRVATLAIPPVTVPRSDPNEK